MSRRQLTSLRSDQLASPRPANVKLTSHVTAEGKGLGSAVRIVADVANEAADALQSGLRTALVDPRARKGLLRVVHVLL